MNKNDYILRICIFFICFFSFFIDAQVPDHLLPDDNEVQGWVLDNETNCTDATAKDSNELYAVIDGGANIFIERDFSGAVFKGFKDSDDKSVCIEIYNQQKRDNAFSVYKDPGIEIGKYVQIDELADSARLDTGYVFDYVLEFVCSQYFIRLSAQEGKNDHYKEQLIKIAKAIEEKAGVAIQSITQPLLTTNEIKMFRDPLKENYMFKINANASSFNDKSHYKAEIFNNKGQLLNTILFQKSAEHYYAVWNRKTSSGQKVARGHYMMLIHSDKGKLSKSFILE